MEKLLIRGGRVIDPANGLDQVADVLVEDGKIAAVGEGLSAAESGIAVEEFQWGLHGSMCFSFSKISKSMAP